MSRTEFGAFLLAVVMFVGGAIMIATNPAVSGATRSCADAAR